MRTKNYVIYFLSSILICIGIVLFITYNIDTFLHVPYAPLIFVILFFFLGMFPFVSYSLLIKKVGIVSEKISINDYLDISKKKIKKFIIDDDSYERRFYKKFHSDIDVYERQKNNEKIRLMLFDINNIDEDINLKKYLDEISLCIKEEISKLGEYECFANLIFIFTSNYEESMIDILNENTYIKSKYGRIGSSRGVEIIPCIIDTANYNIIFGAANSEPLLFEEYKKIIINIISQKSIYK